MVPEIGCSKGGVVRTVELCFTLHLCGEGVVESGRHWRALYLQRESRYLAWGRIYRLQLKGVVDRETRDTKAHCLIEEHRT